MSLNEVSIKNVRDARYAKAIYVQLLCCYIE